MARRGRARRAARGAGRARPPPSTSPRPPPPISTRPTPPPSTPRSRSTRAPRAFDMLGSVRSGAGALAAALDACRPTLAALADIRTGLTGRRDERDGGDGAAAFLLAGDGDGPVLAEPMARASATPSSSSAGACRAMRSRGSGRSASASTLRPARRGRGRERPQAGRRDRRGRRRLIVTGPHGRATGARPVGGRSRARRRRPRRDRRQHRGGARGARPADALDRAQPDELIAVVSLADGCDVTIWRATARDRAAQPAPVARADRRGRPRHVRTFLTWRGFLTREPPRRPDPERPAAPPSFRAEAWKFAFTGSRCQACGARHAPRSGCA